MIKNYIPSVTRMPRTYIKRLCYLVAFLLLGFSASVSAAVNLPGIIQLEDYDGARDSTWYNEGFQYRWGRVDIGKISSGGYYVGWVQKGEYIHYNVDISEAGLYQFDLNVATNVDGRKLHFKLDGNRLGDSVSIPNSGGWQSWTTVSIQRELPAGKHILEVFFESSQINVDAVELSLLQQTPPPPVQTPDRVVSLPGRIEAENFVNFVDSTSGNTGGEYRNTDVDIEVAYDNGGGYNVGWIDRGETLGYDISVTEAGNYIVDARVATIKTGRSFYLSLNGRRIGSEFRVLNTGGWQNWSNVSQEIFLPEGRHQLEIAFLSDELNLNYLSVTKKTSQPTPQPTPPVEPPTQPTEPDPGTPSEVPEGWSLVWRDEFSNSRVDRSKWEYEVNAWGGGNNELQYYTARSKNSYVSNGSLKLVAHRENYRGEDGSRDFTSARIRTKGKVDFRYGRVDVRAKLPEGQGLWPAIWMLPTEDKYGGWASSGEIDIMEAVNLNASGGNEIHGTLHYGGKWPNNTSSGDSVVPSSSVVDNYHVYSIEWEENEIRWYIDGVLYQTQNSWWSEGGSYPAPFDQKFHLILNVAVGGNWPGSPNSRTTFPQTMEVDYVRVYQKDQNNPGTGGSDPCSSTRPYLGAALSLPGRIEAENYDKGCAGVAYFDTDRDNVGNAYRQDEVDIEIAKDTGGGFNLGWLRDGEWLLYTVDVAESGVYDLRFRVASNGNGSTLRLSSDGVDLDGDIRIRNTGGWQNWQTVTARGVQLDSGRQTLRLDILDGDFNLNYIDITSAQAGPHTVNRARGEWTLVVIPDTQHYSENRSNAPIEHMRTAFDWIVDTRNDLNIKFVQGLGDITQNWNNRWEWDNSTSAWDKLYGKLPFMPIIGNHDDPRTMNRYFPVSSFSNEPWWGGDFGGVENNYALMTIGNEDYMFLQVETYDQYSEYRPAGMDWAKGILASYPNRKVILATHDTWATSHIKNNLLTKYDNIVMSNAGHVCQREAYYTTTGPRGGVSNNFVTDYQCDAQEVMLLRYYVFKPLEDRVDYYTYSPVTDQFEVDSSSQGSFRLIQRDP